MKIKNLKLTNFRSYENFTIDFDKKFSMAILEKGLTCD